MTKIILNRHRVFLNAFKYASKEIKNQFEHNSVDDEECFNINNIILIDLTTVEIREIKKLILELPSYLDSAKDEILTNLYNIQRFVDKKHFLNLILIDFIRVYTTSYDMYKALIIDNCFIETSDTVVNVSLFEEYVTTIYSRYYTEWIDYIKKISAIYSIKLEIDDSVLKSTDNFDILNLFNTINKNEFK